MFTPISVKCFTQKTGLPAGSFPFWNPLHSVFKVLSYLAFRVGEPDGREPLVVRSANYCHSAYSSSIPNTAFLLNSSCSFPLFGAALTKSLQAAIVVSRSYPPMPTAGFRQHRQVLAHSVGSTPEE